MKIMVSGSVAYDRIMDFPGKFSDHILPDKIHMLNVCFMINELKENFGGTAGNIAYALSLLGEKPDVVASAGHDFNAYGNWLRENGISTDFIRIIPTEFTAGAYITTDNQDNQITAFNPGAMKHSSAYDFNSLDPQKTIAVVAPGNLDDMYNFIKIYKQRRIPYIFDPGQSLPAWNKNQLLEMISGAKIFISNDYELGLTIEKTRATVQELSSMVEILITTKAEKGSSVMFKRDGRLDTVDIPAVIPFRISDPTGAGDAFRAGLIKGLLLPQQDIIHAVKMGTVSASFCVEVHGTQNYSFTKELFNERFAAEFSLTAY
ncbi:carbohydrate kinase family protein [Candidatus Magnetominusculus dajiuhuensis]|uniref:carbohydrate kinase family protein n=1 Tax=Candidatus Magnetominusculus dajiuhuensis TaxID=3137712 RepID=UPI003B42EFC6